MVYATGYPAGITEAFGRISLDAPLPIAEVVRTGQASWLGTTTAWRTRYPQGLAPHQAARMEAEGYVRRVQDPDDKRGVIAELTRAGKRVLKAAAPTHVDGVRTHLIGHLSPGEQAVLASAFSRVLEHLDELDE
jgi:DNA-binding MarR family transcriptional regulator